MSQTLQEIAQTLRAADKKVQLIYAFNGSGKTRLSRALKELIAPKPDDGSEAEPARLKILYYNAFTEDLFYWDNDLLADAEPKLKIQPNSFTDWILTDQGQEPNITRNFQRYVNDKLTPSFDEAFSEVTFSLETGGDAGSGNFKISKGEESNFIWSVFYTLLQVVIDVLQEPEADARETDQFNQLEYVFIDDPVTSLDENHLIQLAVDLADLIGTAPEGVKFVVTTHSPLFYNVLHNEFGNKLCYLLERLDDGTFDLIEKKGDSNHSFSYHLHLKRLLEQAVEEGKIERFHFMLLRNLYEKTASFLGYPRWSELLPDDQQAYMNRIIQFTSHSTVSNDAVAEPSPEERQVVAFLLAHLKDNYSYWQQAEQNG